MKNKPMITIEKLEQKMETGFAKVTADLTTLIDNLAISVKEGFDRVDERFQQVDKRFEQVDRRFNQMDDRFDRIENISIGGHERRLENLEDDMRLVKTKVGLRKK